jgi:hypothetical protein
MNTHTPTTPRALRALAAFALSVYTAAPALAQANNQPPRCPNVLGQFTTLETYGEWMGFYLGDAPDPTQSNHWQGIVRHPDPTTRIFYVTRNATGTASDRANLAVVRMDSADGLTGDKLRSNRLKRDTETQDTAPPSSDKIVRNIAVTSHKHLGGLQISGNLMAVPYEDPLGSNPQGQVVFFDVSTPESPVQLSHTINSTHNFGVVAFTQLPAPDNRYLLLATYGDNSSIEVFVSQPNDLSTLGPNPTFTLDGGDITGWQVCNNLGGVYCFQTAHFITQTDGQIFLAGAWNTSPAAPVFNGIDAARLFRVNLTASSFSLNLLATKTFNCSANSTGSNGNFNAGTGFYVSPTGNLLLYAVTHDNDGPSGSTSMAEFRNYGGTFNQTPASPCDAWVRLYADHSGWTGNDRGITFDAVDRLAEDYDDFNDLDGGPIPAGFTDQASSLAYCLPVGTIARLYQNDSFDGNYLDLLGTGTTQYVPNLANISWTVGSGHPGDKISSIFFINAPAAGIRVPDQALLPSFAHTLISGGPCAVIRINAASYAENPTFTKNVLIKAVGGTATIGTNP